MALRIYRIKITAAELSRAIVLWFRRDFETQCFADGSTFLVQAKKGGTLAKVAGMSYALTVRLKQQEGGVELTSSPGLWPGDSFRRFVP
ncbi:hypothetical protein, partial [Thermodesulfitimonas sp.]